MTGPGGVPSSVPGSVPSKVPSKVPRRDWFERPVLDVARDLLGAILTRHTADGVVALRLTEVEAYDGATDPGSHAYRGRTRRNATMFGTPGRLYVYRHLGLHHCVNVVCGPDGAASAVLLRAGEVVDGADLARARRLASGVARTDRDLARGPARLAVALGLDLSDDGADVTHRDGAVVLRVPAADGPRVGAARVGPPLAEPSSVGTSLGAPSLVDPVEGPRSTADPLLVEPADTAAAAIVVRTGPRVGVSGDGGRADLFPWRFWLDGEPTVSAYRTAPART